MLSTYFMMSIAELFATNIEYSNPYDKILKLLDFKTACSTQQFCIDRILKLHSQQIQR